MTIYGTYYRFNSKGATFTTQAKNLKEAKQNLAIYLRKYHDTDYQKVKSHWKLDKYAYRDRPGAIHSIKIGSKRFKV